MPESLPINNQEYSLHEHLDELPPIAEEVSGPILDLVASGGYESSDIYLGQGTDKIAFLLNPVSGESGPRVLKVIKASEQPMSSEKEATFIRKQTLASVAPLEAGSGIAGLEQLLAVDVDKGLLMTTLIPGKKISTMTSRELMGIRKSHLLQLEQTLQEMRARHLHPHNAGGMFFDKQEGFGFADYDQDTTDTNRGSIDTLEEFLRYALTDFKKLDQLMAQKMEGNNIPMEKFETTGLRAVIRTSLIRRASKLK